MILGVELLENVVSKAQPLHGAGYEVLDDHVRFLHQLLDDLLSLGALEVDGDVFLVEVEGVEGGAGPLEEGSGAEAADGAPRWLDLDDLGAQLRKHHRAEGPEPDVGQVEHPDILEYLGHVNPV